MAVPVASQWSVDRPRTRLDSWPGLHCWRRSLLKLSLRLPDHVYRSSLGDCWHGPIYIHQTQPQPHVLACAPNTATGVAPVNYVMYLGQVGNAEDKANCVENVGFAWTIKTCNGIEFRVPASNMSPWDVGLETFNNQFFEVHSASPSRSLFISLSASDPKGEPSSWFFHCPRETNCLETHGN